MFMTLKTSLSVTPLMTLFSLGLPRVRFLPCALLVSVCGGAGESDSHAL